MATYYVDFAAGNDTTGTGASGAPWKTIAKFHTTGANGDTCKVRGSAAAPHREINVNITKTDMIIEADTGHTPTIFGTTEFTSWAKTGGQTNVYQATYTPAACHRVFNGTTQLTTVASIAACDAATNTFFADLTGDLLYVNIGGSAPTSLEVMTAFNDAISLTGANSIVRNLAFRMCGGNNVRLVGSATQMQDCTFSYLYGPGGGNAIRFAGSNQIADGAVLTIDVSYVPVRFFTNASGAIARNITVNGPCQYGFSSDNGSGHVIEDCIVNSADIDGFRVANGSDITCRRCIAKDCEHGGFLANGAGSTLICEHCISYVLTDSGEQGYGFVAEVSGSFTAYHCVAAFSKRTTGLIRAGFFVLNTATGYARNCLAYSDTLGFQGDTGAAFDVDYCCAYDCTTAFGGAGLTNGGHNITTNPLIVNAGLGVEDFHLQSGSPAIDAGLAIAGINDDYLGSAPDIGAYEFVAAGGGAPLTLMMQHLSLSGGAR